MFYISAAIHVVGVVFYCIFADGDIQDWVRCYMVSDGLQIEVNSETKKPTSEAELKDIEGAKQT